MYEPSLEELPFGQWVRRRRRALGLTQTQLAERAGLAQSNLAAIETGRRGAGESTAERLRSALVARPSELLARNRTAVLDAAQRHRVGNVRVFGSVARGEDSPGDSDIDLLVDLPAGDRVSAFLGFADDAARILTVAVDVVPDDPAAIGRVLTSARAEAAPL